MRKIFLTILLSNLLLLQNTYSKDDQYVKEEIQVKEPPARMVSDVRKSHTPHSSVGQLEFIVFDQKHKQNAQAVGTGTKISKELILSVAHNFVDRCEKNDSNTMVEIMVQNPKIFFEGMNKIYSIKKVYIPNNYCEEQELNDIAVAEIERGFGLEDWLYGEIPNLNIGNFPVGLAGNIDIKIVGYPCNQIGGDFQCLMHEDNGMILKKFQNRKFSYDVNTNPGSSGSAVLNSANEVIGVHTSGDAFNNENIGLTLESSWIKDIEEGKTPANWFKHDYSHDKKEDL